MKVGYFDCFSGAAGDMIVGACLDAGASVEGLRCELAKLRLGGIELRIEKVLKHGISATAFVPICGGVAVDAEGGHSHGKADDHAHHVGLAGGHHGVHRRLPDIVDLIHNAGLSPGAAERAIGVFRRLAGAEACVHGTTEDDIHFHEVGAADAIMDIVGACVALELLGVEKVYCSPVTVGGGTVRCAHGVLPVPAPATVELLKGCDVEIAPSDVRSELLTPTGAAILTHVAESFGSMPAMNIERVGYGAGQRDYEGQPNVLRLLVGETSRGEQHSDHVCVLQTNIDDATAELIGHVTELLLEAGALDVYCEAIVMKKNRPGTLLSVICRPGDAGALERMIFRETTTFGIRRQLCGRSVLDRCIRTVETVFGSIAVKLGYLDGELLSCSPEFADCREAAARHKVPVKTVVAAALAASQQEL